jgi:hypothetical protein
MDINHFCVKKKRIACTENRGFFPAMQAWPMNDSLKKETQSIDLEPVFSKRLEVQLFYLLPCPRCFAQELQTRFDGRVVIETTDVDAHAQFFPAVFGF